jgi:hypothetical protein
MTWAIAYYEQGNGAQPAEVFEDWLDQAHVKLAAKLARVFVAITQSGRNLGGGLIEPCHGYPGLWEARAIFNSLLAHEFFGWDGDTAILLHGYAKRMREPASVADMRTAHGYWHDYLTTRRVSPP